MQARSVSANSVTGSNSPARRQPARLSRDQRRYRHPHHQAGAHRRHRRAVGAERSADLFENIVEKPGFRLCDMLVKNRRSQARALGVSRRII